MRTETPSSMEPFSGYPSFEEAKMAAMSERIENVSEDLIRYFSAPGREMEIGPLFFSLDFPKQIQFIESLLAEVFEGEAGHNNPPIIEYRKKISNELRLVKNEINLGMALSEARIKADAAVKFFRANPHEIRRFFADLIRQYPDDSKAITLNLLVHLLKKLQGSAN